MSHASLFITLGTLFFVGCMNATPSLKNRYDTMMDVASMQRVAPSILHTRTFELFSLQPLLTCNNKEMHVYIEGDGLSWKTRSLISDDPTPLFPQALSLMAQDSFPCKVYLARPCQYGMGKNCNEIYWTSHRLNENIIYSYHEALDQLKKAHGVSHFTLIGYSGGGAIAALVAAKRDDVKRLITVAGNLDIATWAKLHRIDPLSGSLNPADFTVSLERIKQYHLIGKEDTVVPKAVFFSYLERFKTRDKISYNFYDASHSCCWEEAYKKFLDKEISYE